MNIQKEGLSPLMSNYDLGGDNVNCLKCGVEFHESDIEVMESGEEPICDDCALKSLEK